MLPGRSPGDLRVEARRLCPWVPALRFAAAGKRGGRTRCEAETLRAGRRRSKGKGPAFRRAFEFVVQPETKNQLDVPVTMTPDTKRSSLLASPKPLKAPPLAAGRSCGATICGEAGAPEPDCDSGSCR